MGGGRAALRDAAGAQKAGRRPAGLRSAPRCSAKKTIERKRSEGAPPEEAALPRRHQERFALSRPNALSDEPGTVWNATLTRFHALMAITANVRSESSFSDSCVRTRS